MFDQKPYSIKVGIYLPKIYLYHANRYRYQFYKDKILYKACCRKVVDYFTLRYGGCTRVEAIGSYKPKNANDVAYNIHEQVVYAYIPDNCLNEQELYNLCSGCCKVLRQDTIAIEVNNEMYFISKNE
ncbi:hypothetical protein [[Clostridium] fimetarium]|uniref:Uncharacterized protein n=1 Tax=[Clostridium] fimetarium TaxID=99656 RepID=A0A1I0QN76_9FIRM|nr:hypothetical protein [[Clostridium] fimetarium]SEW28842.1 hypothetical protein SAMN05421659_108183 [[Clostridium] fimetarium]